MALGLFLFAALNGNLTLSFRDAGVERGHRLAYRLKFKSDLAASAAKASHLVLGSAGLALQALLVAIESGDVLLGLNDLVAALRFRGHDLHQGFATHLLLAFRGGQQRSRRLQLL